jgi:hypothetical protein
VNPHPGTTGADPELEGIIRRRPAVPIVPGHDRTRAERDRLAFRTDQLNPLACDRHPIRGGVEGAADGGAAIVRSPLKARRIVRRDATRNWVRPVQDPARRGSRGDPPKHDDRRPTRHGWNISGPVGRRRWPLALASVNWRLSPLAAVIDHYGGSARGDAPLPEHGSRARLEIGPARGRAAHGCEPRHGSSAPGDLHRLAALDPRQHPLEVLPELTDRQLSQPCTTFCQTMVSQSRRRRRGVRAVGGRRFRGAAARTRGARRS